MLLNKLLKKKYQVFLKSAGASCDNPYTSQLIYTFLLFGYLERII